MSNGAHVAFHALAVRRTWLLALFSLAVFLALIAGCPTLVVVVPTGGGVNGAVLTELDIVSAAAGSSPRQMLVPDFPLYVKEITTRF